MRSSPIGRALVLRAREPQEGEIEALSRAASLVWERVGKADEKRAAAREATRKAQEKHRHEMLANQQAAIFGWTDS